MSATGLTEDPSKYDIPERPSVDTVTESRFEKVILDKSPLPKDAKEIINFISSITESFTEEIGGFIGYAGFDVVTFRKKMMSSMSGVDIFLCILFFIIRAIT